MTNAMRLDPVFERPTPLVFAHRGGAGEVPESTALAFQHAIAVGADVLEVDLRVTADKQIVVWHGPKLDNVFSLEGVLRGRDIRRSEWKGLAGKAWVIHPGESRPYRQSPQRQLLSFEDFVNTVERLESERSLRHLTGWNIELKSSRGWDDELPRLFSLLDQQVVRRKIAIALAFGGIAGVSAALERSPVRERYATNLSFWGQLKDWTLRHLGASGASLARRSVQTSYSVVTRGFVEDVHARGGAVHAFLTGFGPTKGIDHLPMPELRQRVFALLDTGVDGLMTDYPSRVMRLVREWREGNES
jgi:glycerophosphoryl diester phosphodiesterase